jgi:hypothetical protein
MTVVSNYDPYAPNSQGLTEVLMDLKSTIAATIHPAVAGFIAECFEDVSQGQALYSRTSDGKVGKAIANMTEDMATVVGFAQTTKFSGQRVRVLTMGILSTSGLDAGDIYYLSATTAGGISTIPTSTPGHYLTRVGEAALSTQLIIQLEPPIKLS